MKVKYPAEAFAFGMVLFSAGMKEAFISGILVLFTAVFAEVLSNLLKPLLPVWSWKGCVYVAAAAVSFGAFRLGFLAAGMPQDWAGGVMCFVLGLLAAKHIVSGAVEAEYGELFWESAVLWGFWILLAIAREFFGAGTVFGNLIFQADFQSGIFKDMIFGFLTAGMALAFTNGILKKSCRDVHGLQLVIPLAIFMRPFAMESFGEIIGLLWTAAVSVVLFISVKRTLKFAGTGKAYRGLPVEMLSMGFIYMILSIY